MDILVTISCWLLLVIVVITVLLSPFLIGKEREPYTAGSYILNLVTSILISIVVGNRFGWW